MHPPHPRYRPPPPHNDDDDDVTSSSREDIEAFTTHYDAYTPPVELDMSGHDTHLLGPKIVMLDSFVVDLLNVDTSAQTFRLKLILNMDWEDDGIIEPEVKAKRNLGRTASLKKRELSSTEESSVHPSIIGGSGSGSGSGYAVDESITSTTSSGSSNNYRTGKYILKQEYREDPLTTTWNPEVVLMNGIADESPIEAGSNFHSVQMLAGRPVISRSVLYQPECRCAFSFSNFPFDETDLVVKFGSNKWSSEQVKFVWSQRLEGNTNMTTTKGGRRIRTTASRANSILHRGVDENAIGGVGLSEFEIIKIRVESDEKDVNSLHKYDNADGAFSHAHLIIRVRRDPYSYLLRVSSVAELLMFLEVLSFLAHNDDLAARFSISGTIFLAMVSLYGPMADALPKVSVVTRVDKWHLQNFVLLFASNVENLIAHMLRNVVPESMVQYMEMVLAIVYLYMVIKNLIWFIKPLKDREDFLPLRIWIEDRLDVIVCKMMILFVPSLWWTKASRKVAVAEEKKKTNGSGSRHPSSEGDTTTIISATRPTVRIKNS